MKQRRGGGGGPQLKQQSSNNNDSNNNNIQMKQQNQEQQSRNVATSVNNDENAVDTNSDNNNNDNDDLNLTDEQRAYMRKQALHRAWKELEANMREQINQQRKEIDESNAVLQRQTEELLKLKETVQRQAIENAVRAELIKCNVQLNAIREEKEKLERAKAKSSILKKINNNTKIFNVSRFWQRCKQKTFRDWVNLGLSVLVFAFAFQCFGSTLLCLDLMSSVRVHDNPSLYLSSSSLWLGTNTAANVVRITQVLAIIIAAASQDDVRRLFTEDAPRRGTGSLTYMITACWRLMEGGVGLVLTIFMIMKADNVIDILLNFITMEFLFFLDNAAFKLGEVTATQNTPIGNFNSSVRNNINDRGKNGQNNLSQRDIVTLYARVFDSIKEGSGQEMKSSYPVSDPKQRRILFRVLFLLTLIAMDIG